MASITFTNPGQLYLLFIIPFIILFHFISLKMKRAQAFKFANFEAIERIKGIDFFSKNIFVLGISCLIVFCLVFALAGTVVAVERPISDTTFVIALDASRSMEATDFIPSRMEAAKSTSMDFVDKAPLSTNIGVISFAGNTIIEERVTDDKGLIKDAIDHVNVTYIGGSNVYNAVLTGTILLENHNNKAIIILSDGQFNEGDLEATIDYASRSQIVLYTIGIGTPEGGNTTFGISRLDSETLTALSSGTNGKFYTAENEGALESAYSDILNIKTRLEPLNISKYLLIFAIFLMLLEYVLINTRFSVLP